MDPTVVFLSETELNLGAHEITPYELRNVTSIDEEKKFGEKAEVAVVPAGSLGADDYPDGGIRAWVVVFGAFCACFSSWGYLNSWAVFQAYYQQGVLHRYTPSEIAWIGSSQHSLGFLPGILCGLLFDKGLFRLIYVPASLLVVVGTFLVPLCKVYWHFLLCQGLMIGLGCGVIFSFAVNVLTQWWKRRRGIAVGIAASGGAFGGCFFPIVVRKLLAEAGFAWTFRILGFILMFTLGIANLCVFRRQSASKTGNSFGLRVLRNPAFALWTTSGFFTVLGGFTILTYVSTTAISIGMSRDFAFYIVAVINGSMGVGRIFCGWSADRIEGPLNVIIPMSALMGAITIAWPFCRTVRSLITISTIYGFSLGAFSSLCLVVSAGMGGADDRGLRIGILNTVLGIGSLCGPPLGGLLKSTDLGYKGVGFYGGVHLLTPYSKRLILKLTSL
ncbi:MFS general substrate transporter [Mycena galopus ATCC 62051]|nr:MFS general substrate transporter [Mycena galopus ATCC 62051]